MHLFIIFNYKTSVNSCKLVFVFHVKMWYVITKTFKNTWKRFNFSIEHCNLPEKYDEDFSVQTAQLLIFSLVAITGRKNNKTVIIFLIFSTVPIFFQ